MLVELTAGNPEGALLPVKRVELQVHRAGKSQGDPVEENSLIYFFFSCYKLAVLIVSRERILNSWNGAKLTNGPAEIFSPS